MHLPPGEFIAAREATRKHVRDSLQPTDRAAVFTTSGKVMLDFTHDRALIDQALLKILPQMRAVESHECPGISYYAADAIVNRSDSDALRIATGDYRRCNPAANSISAGMDVRAAANRMLSRGSMDTQITLSTLSDVIRRTALIPGERLVVLVSSGFFLQADFRHQESELIDRAIRSHVIVSTVDARGLFGSNPAGDPSVNRVSPRTAGRYTMLESEAALSDGDTLGEFAHGTGGVWFHNNNDLVEGLKQVAAAPACYYVLGFSPADLKLDGSFHALKVSVKTKNLTPQARLGYFASKVATSKEDQAKADIHEAFMSRDEIQEIPVTVRTAVLDTHLSVIARIELKNLPFRKVDARNLDALTVVAGLFDLDGKIAVEGVSKTINLAIKDETLAARKADSMETKLTFDAPTGKYVLRLVVRDSEGERIGTRNSAVVIP
jgi:VWFA-related protein